MGVMEYISIVVFGIYFIMIASYAYGWIKLKSINQTEESIETFVSIVIACRNESNNIDILIQSLVSQNYSKEKLECIFVNDHSDDNTSEIVESYCKKYNWIKLYNLPTQQSGKKDAIKFGILNSSSEIIITTDADCSLPPSWITNLMNYYKKYSPKLLVGPVVFKNSSNIFQKLQSLEFLSLVGSGAGAIGIHKPIMNNGANLLFEKSFFLDSNQQNKFASGDDIFLMLHAKKKFRNDIHFIKSKEAIVYTSSPKTLKQFYNQRIRWTSKSKAYRDFDIIFAALVVAITNLILTISLIYSFVDVSYFTLFLSLFCIKSTADLLLLFQVSAFFNKNHLLWFFIPLQIIYPFYIISVTTFGLLGKFTWKNRSFKEKR